MGLIEKVKGWINMFFLSQAKEEFNIVSITSTSMENLIAKSAKIYAGKPYWVTADDNSIKTINFAKSLCSETARLATLGIKITIDGSARAEWLQKQIDDIYFDLRHWVEYGCAYGTIILKPNGESIDVVTPNNFTITAKDNTKITGIVFQDQIRSNDGEHWYTRLEYHREVITSIGSRYIVTNKTYYGDSESDLGNPIDISKTPWKSLEEETIIENAKGNLYAVLKMPHANNVDIDSPLGMPIFSDAIEELKDLDIAYSRNALEIIQSKRTVLLDADRMITNGQKTKNIDYSNVVDNMGLPDMVKVVEGTGEKDFYQEINPAIQTDARLVGINALLSQIGYKCGFSNGYFVFNEKMGLQTATAVEADQQRTIQFIKDVRDQIESALDQLIYALNAFADGYDLAPVGEYEVNFDFGDITYNYEEDKNRWWGYVLQGVIPTWKFFEKFEGMTEEEAKQMVEEAKNIKLNDALQQQSLFAGINGMMGAEE